MTAEAEEDAEEGEGLGMNALFTCEDYEEATFDLGTVSQRLLCSQAASTDFDLTGQIVWPVSVFLSWFVAARPAEFRGKVVVELGAGCGLAGVVAARVGARAAVLTDGSDVVMRLLARQVEAFDEGDGSGTLAALKVVWGERADLEALLQLVRNAFGATQDDVVLVGADVVCWPAFVVPLLETVKGLMLAAPRPFNARMYIGYVCRATNTRDQFFAAAADMGLALSKIDPATFLPRTRKDGGGEAPVSPAATSATPQTPPTAGAGSLSTGAGSSDEGEWEWPANVRSNNELELYCIALDPDSDAALVPPAMAGADPDARQAAPC